MQSILMSIVSVLKFDDNDSLSMVNIHVSRILHCIHRETLTALYHSHLWYRDVHTAVPALRSYRDCTSYEKNLPWYRLVRKIAVPQLCFTAMYHGCAHPCFMAVNNRAATRFCFTAQYQSYTHHSCASHIFA